MFLGQVSMLYEVMTILGSQFSDAEIDGAVEEVGKKFTAAGGSIAKTTNLGKLRLAYPIEQAKFGTYVLYFVELEPTGLKKLDQDLRLSEEILRHLIIARPAGVPAADFRPSSYQPPATPEGRRASDREERPAPRREHAPEKSERMSTEALNEKLDQILDSDIMKNI